MPYLPGYFKVWHKRLACKFAGRPAQQRAGALAVGRRPRAASKPPTLHLGSRPEEGCTGCLRRPDSGGLNAQFPAIHGSAFGIIVKAMAPQAGALQEVR